MTAAMSIHGGGAGGVEPMTPAETPHQNNGTISGMVLAGGRASRMGADKAAVEVLGIPLLRRAVELLEPVVDDLIIVTRDQTGVLGRARIISDEVKDRGPLGGLLSGLRAARHSRALVIPMDMPLLTVDFLRYLARASGGWEITVPRWTGGLEPLVSVYATACTGSLERFIARPSASARDFVRSTDFSVRYVDEGEVWQFGDPVRLFFNVNTTEDVQRAEAMLREGFVAP